MLVIEPMSGLYLHIPFCKQACSYCDFYFVTRKDHKAEFVEELVLEIESKKGTAFTEEKVKTIYFGGGTPSLLSTEEVDRIMQSIASIFDLDLKEVTLEMNPDDVTPEYLSGLKKAGITRASMGVQTFDENLLKFMNRAHSREEAISCLEALSTSGFDSFTVDLIYGNPGQSLEGLATDIEIMLTYNPPHISAYSLTIEPRTRLGKQLELGRLIPAEDDIVAQHFNLINTKLSEAGIHRYEVSNYARRGFEAVHNSAYWNHENYLGLGPGAHSFWWDGEQKSAKRWNNASNLKEYLHGNWKQRNEEETLDLKSLAEEKLMLGLRTVKGVALDKLENKYDFRFNDEQRAYLIQKEAEGKVILDEQQLRLSEDGLIISDAILLDLIS